MRVFLDTNVLIYAVFDEIEDRPKRHIARNLLAGNECSLSIQVIQEFVVQATRVTRAERLSIGNALRFVDTWRRHAVQETTMAVFDDATMLLQRHKLSFWDSTIVAAARAQGCDILYSEDMQDGRIIDRLRIVNPFA